MSSADALQALAQRIDERYRLVHNCKSNPLAYGTAGFRTDGMTLPPVAARVIVIAVLRAWYFTCRADRQKESPSYIVGFMITASHNPSHDNGFKIIDTDGGMLTASWEHWCTEAANAATGAELVSVVRSCAAVAGISLPPSFSSPIAAILLGRDTRPSGVMIEAAANDILTNTLHVPFKNFGVLTTPQLHFLVAKANSADAEPTSLGVAAYNEEILFCFEQLFQTTQTGMNATSSAPQRIVVDGANGVGTIGLQGLLEYAKTRGGDDVLSRMFDFEMVNDVVNDAHLLNSNCGADFAKQHGVPSAQMEAWASSTQAGAVSDATHFYCFDGDADRLVAFLHQSGAANNWVLLDGDRISILFAMLLHKWLGEEVMGELDVGVVQTAYANGASTEFLRESLHMPVYIAATGVKNLHPIAHARDIGVYFEANGHGTVLVSDRVVKDDSRPDVAKFRPLLLRVRGLLSQVCGDAIGDMLMCEVALMALNMSFVDWAALYTDRPCKQVKVTVAHPKRITNTADEQRALSPEGMQEEIDAAVAAAFGSAKAARSFVRPSGTEPVVRVYGEATAPEVCESLCATVCTIVSKYCS